MILLLAACSDFALVGEKDPAPEGSDSATDPGVDVGDTGETADPCDSAPPPALAIALGTPEPDPERGEPTCTDVGTVDWTLVEEWSTPLDGCVMDVVAAPNRGQPWASVFIDELSDVVRELDGRDGSEIELHYTGERDDDGSVPAVGDVDGDGDLDLVTQKWGHVVLIDTGDYSERTYNLPWTLDLGSTEPEYPDEVVQLADVDGDGKPELVFPMGVMSLDGARLVSLPDAVESTGAFAMDLDGDRLPEVVNGAGIWNARDGTGAAWSEGLGPFWSFYGAAVDRGGRPEILFSTGDERAALSRLDGSPEWSMELPRGRLLTASADTTGDGVPEMCVILWPSRGLGLLDANGELVQIWDDGTLDMLAGGCSMADLDADGRYEVIVGSATGVFVLDGATGAILASAPDLATTGRDSAPIVLDLDADGSAEILAHTPDRLVALGPATGRWARTRPVWNQLAYDVTSVRDDGTVVSGPRPAWQALNTFRAQPSPIRARAPVSARLFSASEAPLSSAPGRPGAPSLPPPSPDANKVASSNAAEDRAVRSGSRDGEHPDLALELTGGTAPDECDVEVTTLTGWLRNVGSTDAAAGAVVALLTRDSAGVHELGRAPLEAPLAPGERAGVAITVPREDLAAVWIAEVLPAHLDECDLGNDRVDGVP